MSIGRRFLKMARSELNSLLDFAAKHTDDDIDGATRHLDDSLNGFSAKELEEELERRRGARQEVEDAIHGRRPSHAGSGSTTRPGAPSGSSRGSGSGVGGDTLRIQKAYAALEVQPGADFVTVRQAYRTLMRKYHPDHHTESPAKQRAANEVAQRLTDAYKLLEKRLRK